MGALRHLPRRMSRLVSGEPSPVVPMQGFRRPPTQCQSGRHMLLGALLVAIQIREDRTDCRKIAPIAREQPLN